MNELMIIKFNNISLTEQKAIAEIEEIAKKARLEVGFTELD